jgi:hypothetical protein
MPLETKFLRPRAPVTIGSRFGDWEVSWLGGWTRNRLCYLVMVVRVPLCSKLTNSRSGVNGPHLDRTWVFTSGLAIPPSHYGELGASRPTTLLGGPSVRIPHRIEVYWLVNAPSSQSVIS